MTAEFDSVLVVSFGGPEQACDIEPFLRRVTAGRDIPAERLSAVADQYRQIGGASPLNEQCRRLTAALAQQLKEAGRDLPVYWGNRNWHPLLAEAVAEMATAGHRRALAVVTSAYSSYSGCRQYLDDLASARAEVGDSAPAIHKVRPYYDHPGFIEPFAEAVTVARRQLPADLQAGAHLVFTAHSIPVAMARGCAYEAQLRCTADLIAQRSGFGKWTLAWQSRSGPPSVPWLEPDINDHLKELAAGGRVGSHACAAVVAPIGFVTDHAEVLWDLDVVAAKTATQVGITLQRAVTPGTQPDERFVAMWHELIEERFDPGRPRRRLGDLGIAPDACPPTCCPARS